MTATYEHQDIHNPSKVWVIRKAGTRYEWNQKIDGNLFYEEWSYVDAQWIAVVLGSDVARDAILYLDNAYHEEQRIYDEFCDRMTDEDMAIFAGLRSWSCANQVRADMLDYHKMLSTLRAKENAFYHADDNLMQPGQDLQVWVNQGMRDAIVLGVIEDEMIVEYEMPAGTTAMLVMPRDFSRNWGRSVSYSRCPKKWLKAIFHGTGWWTGRSQTGTEYAFPPMRKNVDFPGGDQ